MPNGLRITSFLLLAFAAAQQQHPQNGYGSSPHENAALRPNTLRQPGELPLRVDTSTFKRGRSTSSVLQNKRAVATTAPADLNPAVRAPPARSAAGPSGGLTSPSRARSLQDWEVENFVLLATVDGSIYARDRRTGEELWKFYSERPMVETVYYRNDSRTSGKHRKDDYMWIVEPNEDGSLYVFIPGPDAGIQKLGMTVKELAEVLSPYASEDSPFVFTAEKRNTLFTLNATNGAAIKYFSAGGSGVMDQKSCRRTDNLIMDEDEDECEPTPTLHLGRTEYTVGIQDKNSGENVCTIRYFEWTPNNRDRDLADKYLTTMDNKYIYSRFDGSIVSFEHQTNDVDPRRLYQKKATSPVVRVFDVVRPHGVDARDTPLVILPQPIAPIMKDERPANVFVNCTESGSWYAMSEMSYPSVTDGAATAECYTGRDLIDDRSWWEDDQEYFKPSELIGVHSLSDEWREQPANIPAISPPDEPLPVPTEDPRVDSGNLSTKWSAEAPSQTAFGTFLASLLHGNAAAFLIVLAAIGWGVQQTKRASVLQANSLQFEEPRRALAPPVAEPAPTPITVAITESTAVPPSPEAGGERKVRFAPFEEEELAQNSLSRVTTEEIVASEGAKALPEGTPKRRKAHRGSRGSRKGKKKPKAEEEADEELSRIMDGVIGPKQTLQPDQETHIEGNIDDISDFVQINNQLIHTDRVLGYGSGGTTVYEGTFEVRSSVDELLVHVANTMIGTRSRCQAYAFELL